MLSREFRPGLARCCALNASGWGSSGDKRGRSRVPLVLSSSPKQSPTRTRSAHVTMKKGSKKKTGLIFDRLRSADQDPISSAQSLGRQDDASQDDASHKAGPATIENAGSKVDEVTQLRCLPSPGGLGQGPVRVSKANDLAPYSSTPRLFSTTIKTRHSTLAATS